ncbi:MAG: carbon starvation CstA family protein [Candidatus Hatepunaea meridiana]|nr:carbon starvation CstA family protein [Candidatus Hatepunaea meridiana]
MTLLIILIISLAAYYLAVRWYGRGVARWIKLDNSETTPAVEINDGRDYVPTKLHIVFAHHFATIAGAGPIIGPVVAVLYGFVPAWLWILLGGIFFGAVHDFTSMFVSVKESGKSIAEITRKAVGKTGFILFISFAIFMLLLVTAAFLNATAMALTSSWPLEKLGLDETQTILHTVRNATSPMGIEGVIGGIASTSVIIITILAPLLGWLIFRRGLKTVAAYIIAAVVAIGSVLVGFRFPVTFEPQTWMIIISIYCFIAAGLPVWFILQPRDFTNVQLLYGGMIILIVGVVGSGIQGVEISFPATSVVEGTARLGMIWPIMFITIACGAISGFHALVSSGTTSKQVEQQVYTRKVGYGAMLLESMLALLVLLALAGGLKYVDYIHLVHPVTGKGNPILAFALAVGSMMKNVTGLPLYVGCIVGILMVEGFVITSLDTAIRFIRYLLEELWQLLFDPVPALFRSPWFSSGIAVILMWGLAAGNTFGALWPIFGSANQLMAAMTLITITMWLMLRGLKTWFTVIPAMFMTITTVTSLIILLFTKYLPAGNYTLVTASVVLLVMAVTLVFVAFARAKELGEKDEEGILNQI